MLDKLGREGGEHGGFHLETRIYIRAIGNLLLLAGDHRAHPSVQGTLQSAERVLRHLNIPIPRRA